MKITVAVDNRENPPFLAEFGLALVLDTDSGRFLFDTGAGQALAANLSQLGIAAGSIRRVILSHGHYDHTGGLAGLHPEEIWCCREIQSGHYSLHADQTVHQISMPDTARSVLEQARIHWVGTFQEFAPGLYLTGPIPRRSGEDCGGSFFHDGSCRIPDSVSEEQALLTSSGILITGCCHAGIINSVRHCAEIHPEIPVHTVVGGLHLRNADDQRLKRTADFFRECGIRDLVLLHCTGEAALDYLRTALPECRISSPLPGESFILP